LLPQRLAGNAPHLVPRIRHRLEPTVLRMRSTRLERHHEGLARRVHHGVRHQCALPVDAMQDLETYADPRLGSRLAPGAFRLRDCREQRIEIDLRVRDAQRETVRRTFAPHPALSTRQIELEWLV